MKRDIKSFSLPELHQSLAALGEKPYRAAQIFRWLYGWSGEPKQVGVQAFDEMLNLGKALQEKLSEHFFISRLEPANETLSTEIESSQTLKFLFRLTDGKEIESVLIPNHTHGRERWTVCVSSQVGCALACTFCATGYMGFTRNLTAGEIVDQVAFIQSWLTLHLDKTVTNVVFMGMGEPLLNLDHCLEAADMLSSSDYAFQIAPSRITLSTSGIATGIRKLADLGVKYKLALSLHSAIEEKRAAMMPVTNEFSLAELRSALKHYYDRTKKEVFYEYTLLAGINDGAEDADALIRFSHTVPCKINLIDYNPIANIDFTRPAEARQEAFIQRLHDAGLTVTLRRSRGKDIDAACGQLATASRSEKKIVRPVHT